MRERRRRNKEKGIEERRRRKKEKKLVRKIKCERRGERRMSKVVEGKEKETKE